ncbi:MAG TPA: HAMP domain-containing sensor histidine kinase [Vicinamibacterales bacterium]|nr:HAMP domain-containing sensor histidine kinase [Vicinamibacterales bacterium]
MSSSLKPSLREQRISAKRLILGGLAIALIAAISGAFIEIWRFGLTRGATQTRVEQQVRRDFERTTTALSRVAVGVAMDPDAARALSGGPDAARDLFNLLDRRLSDAAASPDAIAVTIYDRAGVALAWVGRPSDVGVSARLTGPSAFYVAPTPLGLRLVHVLPILEADQRRLGSVVAEHALSRASATATFTATGYVLDTPVGPGSLRTRAEGAGDRPRENAFLLRSPGGETLVEVSLLPDTLDTARRTWRRHVAAALLWIAGITILLVLGPVLDRRAQATTARDFLRSTALSLLLLAAGSAVIGVALAIELGRRPPPSVLVLTAGATTAAAIALLAGPVVRLRIALRARRQNVEGAAVGFISRQLLAGIAVAAVLLVFELLLPRVVDPVTADLRRFSLYPWNAKRLALLTGVLASHAAALWTATLILSAALARWRLSTAARSRIQVLLLWLGPSVAIGLMAPVRGWSLPSVALILSAFTCAVAALIASRVVVWYRHTTVAARILALFAAFLLPALLLYPSVDYYAERAMRALVESRYATQAQQYSQFLQERLSEARAEIDALESLPVLVTEQPIEPKPCERTQPAYFVWSRTALGRARLTSAVELYDAAGECVSRFGLDLPEYSGTAQAPHIEGKPCDWDVFGEAAPFGAAERRLLHAARQICTMPSGDEPRRVVGTIVVHVLVFDYRTLPFITSQSPYFEVFRPADAGTGLDDVAGSEVEVAIYGWGLGAVYNSPHAAWSIDDDLFARIYDPARRPFWTTVQTNGDRYRVFFSNDRVFIYAIGYRTLTLFDHLVHLAELTTLSGVFYVLVLVGTAFFTRLARARPRLGRALLREIRSSFYRKLFLAFVLAAIIPVLILSVAIRWYFANLLTADVALEAARTAAVAQRVIEQSNALTQRTEGLAPASDDVMIWISQVIDQDVNIFEGAQLVATSKRDLFASGLLATRTPDAVYRAIALQRLPSFVGEDRIGTVPYTIAAAPVHAGGKKVILTVPLATRQRDIDREIDDLDRGVHLAALLFVLLGAAIGLSMAERIADPIRRLTRATRQIARGDFDAQIAVRSSDELRRLVDAFNSMAGELKAQRAQLERTHRLEAWAEMARQVAHEIKNPLTPIQLSAEHLRRVHADRGEPMGDVLEGCVNSILSQVKLLRQISAEFSSFASSPTARPAPVDVPELITDVIDPYRTGLSGRIEIVNNVAGPLPRVFVDRTLTARSLANIVENALHAMPGEGRLTIDASSDRQFVTLRVHDDGVGMDEESLARVFEPYFSTKTTGTGLGLPIARRNIELNGGTIEVESGKGRGTTVSVRLPVAVA